MNQIDITVLQQYLCRKTIKIDSSWRFWKTLYLTRKYRLIRILYFWIYWNRKRPLIRPFPSRSGLWSDHSHPEVTYDHIIPIRKWPLIILSPDRKWPPVRRIPAGSDIWSYHFHTELTSDQTISIRNQNPDPLILVWEHTRCLGLGWSEVISGWHLNLELRTSTNIQHMIWWRPKKKMLDQKLLWKDHARLFRAMKTFEIKTCGTLACPVKKDFSLN